MKSLQSVVAGMPLVSGALFALEYGPLCRATGMFRGAPSGAVLGLVQGVAAAGAVATIATTMMGGRSRGITLPTVTMLSGVVAGHALLGALVGLVSAARERRDRFVSPQFLEWLERQDEERVEHAAESTGVREPIQLARHQARREMEKQVTEADVVTVPAARAA